MEQLIPLIKEGGTLAVALVFAFLWWLERGDRLGKDKELSAFLERSIKAIETNKSVIGKLALILGQANPNDGNDD